MHDLIVRYVRGEITDFENRRLQQWRADADENEKEFQQVKSLWERTANLKQPTVDPPPSITQVVTEAESRRWRLRARNRLKNVLRSPWTGFGAAAAAAIVLLILSARTDEGFVESNFVLAPVESSSGPGQVTTIALTDGSVLRLAQDTRVEFLRSREGRELVLEGKAFFAVAHDPRPFVVHSRAGDVVVRGTRFEISAWDDSLRLVVVEGTVSLRGTRGGLDVTAGQVAFLASGAAPRVVAAEDVWPILDWPGGVLMFQETPLSQVMWEIGRRFGKEPQIVDEEIGRRRITAWFADETLQEVIAAVCHIAGARCYVTETNVTVGR